MLYHFADAMRFFRVVPILAAFTTLVPTIAYAQIAYDAADHAYFVTGSATINSDITVNDVFVGKDNATDFNTLPGPFTLTVADGADINFHGGDYPVGAANPMPYDGINVFGGNTVNITGGKATSLSGFDNSVTTITDGTFDWFRYYNNSHVTMSGGLIKTLYTYGSSTCAISGGTLTGQLYGFDSSVSTITGGTVFNVVSTGSSRADIKGGDITYTDNAGGNINISGGMVAVGRGDGLGSGTTTVSGGKVTQFIARGDTALIVKGGTVGEIDAQSLTPVLVQGGNVDSLFAAFGGTAIISGGSVADVFVQNDSAVTIRGGKIGTNTIRLFDSATVNLFGTGLDIASTGSGSDTYGSYRSYTLFGNLTNGDSLTGVNLYRYSDTTTVTTAPGTAAPEPISLTLALPIIIGVVMRRRK